MKDKEDRSYDHAQDFGGVVLLACISERAAPEAEVELRAFNLTTYVKSLQQ
jgi:hypothetical protein